MILVLLLVALAAVALLLVWLSAGRGRALGHSRSAVELEVQVRNWAERFYADPHLRETAGRLVARLQRGGIPIDGINPGARLIEDLDVHLDRTDVWTLLECELESFSATELEGVRTVDQLVRLIAARRPVSPGSSQSQ